MQSLCVACVPASAALEACRSSGHGREGGTSTAPSQRPLLSHLPCQQRGVPQPHRPRVLRTRAVTSGGDGNKTVVKEKGEGDSKTKDVEEVTKKWGLEAGLWKALRGDKGGEASTSGATESAGSSPSSPSNTDVAKQLLSKYGGAYLITSISLAIVSFSFCYVLVDRGVDVASLLQQLGLEVGGTGEKVGTVALAYAAHKAASPIRFAPTVILTPIVANFFAKDKKNEESETKE